MHCSYRCTIFSEIYLFLSLTSLWSLHTSFPQPQYILPGKIIPNDLYKLCKASDLPWYCICTKYNWHILLLENISEQYSSQLSFLSILLVLSLLRRSIHNKWIKCYCFCNKCWMQEQALWWTKMCKLIFTLFSIHSDLCFPVWNSCTKFATTLGLTSDMYITPQTVILLWPMGTFNMVFEIFCIVWWIFYLKYKFFIINPLIHPILSCWLKNRRGIGDIL